MKKSFNFYNPLTWAALGFGTGFSPVAPGTAGSLLASSIYIVLINPLITSFLDYFYFIFFLFISFFIGIFAHDTVVGEDKDPSYFVWDEFLGMWITCLPIVLFEQKLFFLMLSFLVFRILDIIKPWPIIIYDQQEGAYGVMMDDVIAGLLTMPIVILIYLLIF